MQKLSVRQVKTLKQDWYSSRRLSVSFVVYSLPNFCNKAYSVIYYTNCKLSSDFAVSFRLDHRQKYPRNQDQPQICRWHIISTVKWVQRTTLNLLYPKCWKTMIYRPTAPKQKDITSAEMEIATGKRASTETRCLILRES